MSAICFVSKYQVGNNFKAPPKKKKGKKRLRLLASISEKPSIVPGCPGMLHPISIGKFGTTCDWVDLHHQKCLGTVKVRFCIAKMS